MGLLCLLQGGDLGRFIEMKPWVIAGGNSCGALSAKITLAPGETKALAFIVGEKPDAQAEALLKTYADPAEVSRQELRVLHDYWEEKLSRFQVKTPSPEFNTMVNTWNAFNCFMTFLWSRAASFVYCGLRNGYGWVGREHLPDETAKACETALAAFGEDRNGDGKVVVRLHQIPLDLGEIARRGSTSGQQEHASILALNADLNSCQSVLFLLEDPQAFQTFSGALLYLDGSEPLPEADDWENMVLDWTQIFGSAPEGIEGPLYLGCRGCWKEEQREDWRASRQLWEKLS